MGILRNIEWTDPSAVTILYKLPLGKDYIARGSKLTVREGQVAVFCDKGRMADVFLPGFYTLDTDNVPMLTKLMSWKYGFESPFKSDVYFVNTKQFTNEKWGTANPIIIRDADYGAIRVRGYGSYSFKVDDAFIFLQELAGTREYYTTKDITEYLRSMVITGISDTIGESKIPILDMAGNLMELGNLVEKKLSEDFKSIGLKLVKFNFENFSLPPELEKAFDQSASLGMLSKNMGVYTQKAQADALLSAAKNTGTAGGMMGAGLGMGMGMNMANAFGGMMGGMGNQAQSAQTSDSAPCPKCGAKVRTGAKFCPDCGQVMGQKCSKCGAIVNGGAKFCPECGNAISNKCTDCGATLQPGAKFCPECGGKQ